MRMPYRPLLALCLPALALTTGCVGSLNERPTLGGSQRLPALYPGSDRERATTAPSPYAVTTPTTRLDRGSWEPMNFVVPVDGVAHDPVRYSERRYSEDDTPRRFGLFPTVASSLDLSSPSAPQAGEALFALPRVLLDVALFPVRAITQPISKTRQSPSGLYKRTPEGETWWAGPRPAMSTNESAAGDA